MLTVFTPALVEAKIPELVLVQVMYAGVKVWVKLPIHFFFVKKDKNIIIFLVFRMRGFQDFIISADDAEDCLCTWMRLYFFRSSFVFVKGVPAGVVTKSLV